MKKLVRLKRNWILLLLPVSLSLTALASVSPNFAEGYATTVYSWLSIGINWFTSLLPFSLAECLVPLFILLLLAFIVISLVRIIQKKDERGFLTGKLAVNLLCVLSLILFSFTANCGINYYRYTFSQVSGLEVRPSSTDELKVLCLELADSLNGLRGEVKTDSQGIMELDFDNIYAAALEAKSTYAGLEAVFPTLKSGYGPPKPVLASRLMSWCNITGIFFPFTFEANVNVDVPDYSIPATMCHELSHLRGYMREDEANFIAYLACRQSSNTDFRYSGDMLAFLYVSNALFSADSASANEIYSRLDEGIRRDFIANSQYWKQFEGPVAETASKVNDAYLKSNQQEDGVKSYGRMVDLLLADYRHRHELDP